MMSVRNSGFIGQQPPSPIEFGKERERERKILEMEARKGGKQKAQHYSFVFFVGFFVLWRMTSYPISGLSFWWR